MRYAIVSDLHANLQAFEAVLADLSAQKSGCVICLGDAIGYGPQPAEVLSLVHAHVNEMLMGNHEAAVAGLMDTTGFSKGALLSLASTKQKLNQAALAYIADLPYEIEGPAFRCTHADFAAPRDFGYVETEEDALRSFATCAEPLLFVGHTHEAAVFELLPDGTCVKQPPADFVLAEGHRYLVNPGSVGMPRTADPRATYCIFDTEENRLTFQRTSYGVREFRKLVEADARDSEQLAYVMNLIDNHALPVLQARANFSSGVKAAEAGPRRAAQIPRVQAPPPPPPPRRRVRLLTLMLFLLLESVAGLCWWLGQRKAAAEPATAQVRRVARVARWTDAEAAAPTAVRILFDGQQARVPVAMASATRGAVTYHGNTNKDPATATCLAIYTLSTTNTDWQKGEWTIRPEANGEIDLLLLARWSPGSVNAWLLYDDLALEGTALSAGDFEGGAAVTQAWSLARQAIVVTDPRLAHGGAACLKVGTRAPATQRIKVAAGKPLKLTFWYRPLPKP